MEIRKLIRDSIVTNFYSLFSLLFTSHCIFYKVIFIYTFRHFCTNGRIILKFYIPRSCSTSFPFDLCTALGIISLSPLSLETDVTDATLGASGLWLGTTAILAKSFFGRSPWLHGQQVPFLLIS